MFTQKRKLLSQNFLHNRQLVQHLVRSSSIGKKDLVIEIGAGNGIITHELAKRANKVIALEVDPKFLHLLKSKFHLSPNINLIQADFLKFHLPDKQYKVFSNLPFRITADSIRKLLSSSQFQEAHLIVQKEAAAKYLSNRHHHFLISILYYPWYKFQVIHQFNQFDFTPRPRVRPVLLHIVRRTTPLVPNRLKNKYFDYISYHFNKDRTAKLNSSNTWLQQFLLETDRTYYLGHFGKLTKEQTKLPKIYRTRNDPSWRIFRMKK